jgi:hypothetical protein
MPTVIHFVGAEQPLRLDEDYDAVRDLFRDQEAGHFGGESRNQVTIYKSAIAYIEEIEGVPFAETA